MDDLSRDLGERGLLRAALISQRCGFPCLAVGIRLKFSRKPVVLVGASRYFHHSQRKRIESPAKNISLSLVSVADPG